MTDISPALLESLKTDFSKRLNESPKVLKFIKKVRDGTADFASVGDYASDIGDLLVDTFKAVLQDGVLPDNTLYWNIAKSAIEPMLLQNVDLTNDACTVVQSIADQAAHIGLKSIRAPVPEEEIDSILNAAAVPGIGIEGVQNKLSWSSDMTRRVVDSFMKTNAEVRNKSGYRNVIIRKSESHCCKWCTGLAGSYEYDSAPSDIFKRHDNCRCSVIYRTGKTYQDVYSKQTYSAQEEATDEQASWLSRHDRDFAEYRQKYINYQKSKGMTEKKAADMFDSSRKYQLENFGKSKK